MFCWNHLICLDGNDSSVLERPESCTEAKRGKGYCREWWNDVAKGEVVNNFYKYVNDNYLCHKLWRVQRFLLSLKDNLSRNSNLSLSAMTLYAKDTKMKRLKVRMPHGN